MTRDEAISIMNVMVHMLEPQYDTDRIEDAVEMAIKALEQEPCEDAVSRQAVIDTLTKTSGIRGDALKALYDLPSVTPQPKIGKWIMSDDGLYRPICNNCGAHPWKGYIPTVEEATEAFKYCPNCGTKMQEVEIC